MNSKRFPIVASLTLLPISMMLASPAFAAPKAVLDSASSIGGKKINIPVLSNDASPGAGLKNTWSIVSASSANATVTINTSKPIQSIDYTPNPGFLGIDTFSYTFQDGKGQQATGTVKVTVTNRPPTATNDNLLAKTAPTVLMVVQNDFDPEKGPLTIISVENTSIKGGSVSIQDPLASVLYTPPAGFVGTDSFKYTIRDNWGQTATATVTVRVENTAPTAVNDVGSVEVNNLIVIDAIANDSDPEGDALTITKVNAPTAAKKGTVTIVGNKIEYRAGPTPTTTPDVFSYTISDGYGHTKTALVRITITPDDGNPSNNN